MPHKNVGWQEGGWGGQVAGGILGSISNTCTCHLGQKHHSSAPLALHYMSVSHFWRKVPFPSFHVIRKGKPEPLHDQQALRGRKDIASPILSLNTGRGRWSSVCPGHFIPGKETQYPLHRRIGGARGWSGWLRKNWPAVASTIQPAASCYTDYTNPFHAVLFAHSLLLPFLYVNTK